MTERRLDKDAIEKRRLPGALPRDVVEELLRQADLEQGVALQERLSEEEWAIYSAAAAEWWTVDRPIPIVLRPARVRGRPEVFAWFAVHELLTDLPLGTGSGWFIAGYLRRNDGGLAVEQLTLEPELDTETGVTPAVLRAISVPAILAQAQAALLARPEWLATLERLGLASPSTAEKRRARQVAESEAVRSRPKRGRKPRYSNEHYATVAREYLALYKAGVRRGILIRLAEFASERLGRTVTRETMRDWVHRARVLGYLEGGSRGAAGARPGARLKPLT